MAKKAVVEGEVIVRNPNGGFDIEFYEETFTLDDSVESLPEARQIIRKGLIVEKLRKTVKNFKRVRTVEVVSFDESQEQPDNSDLDKLLKKAAQLQCIPENIDNYKRPDFKLKALEKAIEKAEEMAKKHKAKKKKDDVEDLGYVD